ncbi:hypothetical protein [Amycolatopsis aidingensis]|uniref:hypothetical protein n=1 Tax=Amycolatopsis aidingensis TaxID=2842453 RepID=UPI001C0E4C2A|nr:hypothetical protein [Amycolatopsis aidingensis]
MTSTISDTGWGLLESAERHEIYLTAGTSDGEHVMHWPRTDALAASECDDPGGPAPATARLTEYGPGTVEVVTYLRRTGILGLTPVSRDDLRVYRVVPTEAGRVLLAEHRIGGER